MQYVVSVVLNAVYSQSQKPEYLFYVLLLYLHGYPRCTLPEITIHCLFAMFSNLIFLTDNC